MLRRMFVVLCAGAGSVVFSACAQSKGERSAAEFVEKFYSWYAPLAGKRNEPRVPWIVAITERPELFETTLVEALLEDRAAQEQVTGEIVGLDFDPFLFTQDPCEGLEIGKETITKTGARVEVLDLCHGDRMGKVVAVADLAEQNSGWVFHNFYSADGWDLLQTLKVTKEAREVKE